MNIKLLYPGGDVSLPDDNNSTINIPSLVATLEVSADFNSKASVLMGQKVWHLEPGINSLPVLWTPEGICHLKIHIDDNHKSYKVCRMPGNVIEKDQIINYGSFVDDLYRLYENNGFSVNDFISSHKKQAINMLAVEKPQITIEQKDNAKNLRDTLMQQVQAICSRPKKGTKTEELVQDVGLVKEINTNTLSHLAAHTEHWKAKKLNGLEPKRLLSVIIEENIDIYENLFFKMAMDDISDYVTKKLRSLRRFIKQTEKVRNYDKYNRIDYRSGRILSELMGERQYKEMLHFSSEHPEKKILKEWEQVAEVVQSIRNSALYKQIDPRKRISKNIHQTNILRNDQRYKALFQIWQSIRREDEKSKALKPMADQLPDNPGACYATYVFFLLLWTMINRLKIEFDESDRLFVEESMVHATLHGKDKQFRYTVETQYDDFKQLSIAVSFLPPYPEFRLPKECDVSMELLEEYSDYIQIKDGKLIIVNEMDDALYKKISRHFIKKNRYSWKEVWQTFVRDVQEKQRTASRHDARTVVIKPLLFSLSSQNDAPKQFSQNIIQDPEQMTIWITATDIEMDSNGDESPDDEWIRFALSYGEIPFSGCQKPYFSMFLPVTQIDLMSPERIEKALSIHRSFLSMDLAEKNNWKMSYCPACQSLNINQVDRDTWRCLDCGKQWGKTHCQDINCGKYFFWQQPNSDSLKQLRKEDIGDQQKESTRLIKRDTVFGSTIMTDFEYEINNTEGRVDRLLPVCPYCGKRRLK